MSTRQRPSVTWRVSPPVGHTPRLRTCSRPLLGEAESGQGGAQPTAVGTRASHGFLTPKSGLTALPPFSARLPYTHLVA